MKIDKYDFSGYATKNNMICSDGKTIKNGAFKDHTGKKVPLVWEHMHNDPMNVLGHVILENRDDGVYAYGKFNDTAAGENAKTLVKHGDVDALSIYANSLIREKNNILDGVVREVSLVLSGANPGAFIENINLMHGDGSVNELDDEVLIWSGSPLDTTLKHSDEKEEEEEEKKEDVSDDSDDAKTKTYADVLETFNDDQKNALYGIIAQLLDDQEGVDDEEAEEDEEDEEVKHSNQGGIEMKKNVFEGGSQKKEQDMDELRHSILTTAINSQSTLKDSIIAHTQEYGIDNVEVLFPDAKKIDNQPMFVSRDMDWVASVLSSTKKTPFSRVRTMYADITEDAARARGYIKASEKFEEVFPVFTRTTSPQTIYKKQKLDRDDVIDIDFDVITWIRSEMRVMLNEEIARAILIGDGRSNTSPDKIKNDNIRPILYDHPIYTYTVTTASNISGASLIERIIKERKNYKGSGSPSFYTTEDVITDLLLIKDRVGRRLYNTEAELASAMRVKELVAVEVMETLPEVLGIMVNLNDYNIGADRGGEINNFDDFDIDFNQYKYLMETRISGALIKPKAAIAFVRAQGTEVEPEEPSFNEKTGVITIPKQTGVIYKMDDNVLSHGAQTAIDEGETVIVEASPDTGYYFPRNITVDWIFVRDIDEE